MVACGNIMQMPRNKMITLTVPTAKKLNTEIRQLSLRTLN